MAPSKTLLIIAYISVQLVISNIIVIDEFNPNTNEYHCTPDESCTIGCLSTGSCSGTTLYCPSNNDCTIICDGRSNTATKTCFNSTIHAEHSNKLSITVTAHNSNAESMTIYAPYNTNTASIITCNSDTANHNQCKNINIHTNKGFNDIELQCNDDTSLCHISGTMQCQYTTNNICNTFTYQNNQIGYQCNDNNFCLTDVIPPQIALNTTQIIDIVTLNGIDRELYVPVTSGKEKDIHSVVLVIVGTVVICCVLLILLALCGVLFVKINKETVEEILIKRYMSGRGASLSNIEIFHKHIKTNDSNTSNDSNDSECIGMDGNSSSSDTQTMDISHMTTTNQSIQFSDSIHSINNNKSNSNEVNSNYENDNDELDDIQNINTNLGINPLYNLSVEPDDELSGDYDSIVVVGEQSQSITGSPDINNNVSNESDTSSYIVMNEKHRQIHEQHIRNRHKCYGYSQPEILYEEDENYTDDSNSNKNEEEKNSILETNNKSFTKEYDINDMDSESTDDDELLDDGMIITGDIVNANDIQIKIDTIDTVSSPLSVATSDVKDPEIVSDDGHFPNLPPHAIIQYGNNLSVTGKKNVGFKL